ncbi:unnamed protein product [Absidia cylindrospora]
MKFATPSLFITLFISLSMMVDAAPVETKQQDQSLEIQGPTKDSTWVVGRSEAITWKTSSNQPVDIMLSKETSSDVIVIAKNLNGFQGSYVYTVPDSLFSSDQSGDESSSSKWKILIKDNGQIFSTSDDFVISSSAPTEPVNSVTPPAQATTQNHWAATASISLLGPDGKAISMSQTASSASHYQMTSLPTLLLLITLSGFFLSI